MDGTEDVVVGRLYVYGLMHMETRAQYSHGSTCRRKYIIIIIIHNNWDGNDNHQYMSPATPHTPQRSTPRLSPMDPSLQWHNALCVSTLFSVSIYQPFSVSVAILQPSTSPCSPCPCIVSLPCFRLRALVFSHHPHCISLSLVPRPCPTTSLPLQPKAPPTLHSMRHTHYILSRPTYAHGKRGIFTSLPAPPSSGAWPWPWAAERLTTRNSRFPNQVPKPAFQN